MKVQGRMKRGRPKTRWLDKVKDDIKQKGLSADDVYDRAMEAYVYGAPFSHLFTELKISPIEVHISAIELEISPIQLKISPNQLEISTNRPI